MSTGGLGSRRRSVLDDGRNGILVNPTKRVDPVASTLENQDRASDTLSIADLREETAPHLRYVPVPQDGTPDPTDGRLRPTDFAVPLPLDARPVKLARAPTAAGAKLLELGNRRKIYDYLKMVPGIHLRGLQRDLSMPIGTLEYHLYQMEKEGLLVTRENGRFKAYFTQEDLDRRDRDYLYYLRQDMPRRIALEVADEAGISFQRLAERLPISPSTLSFHLKKLLNAAILVETPSGREKTYSCPEPERVRRLIVTYRTTFVDDVVDKFADAWVNLGVA